MKITSPSITLDATAASVPRARAWVRRALVAAGRTELVACAELGVSELVTNAVRHGAGPIVASLTGTPSQPRISVEDHSGDRLIPRVRVSHDAESGRGLALVATASVACGVDYADASKTVWFEPAARLHNEPDLAGFYPSEVH